jgi:ankyrin repeat protein
MTLFEAVESGDVAKVKAALRGAKDVNPSGEGGRTPLIEAAAMGQLEMVKVLLAAGADPTLPDDEKETALLKAAANGHLPVVNILSVHATDDERDMARAFLRAAGKVESPEYQAPDHGAFKRTAAKASAAMSKMVGHDDPSERLERIERGESNARRKK